MEERKNTDIKITCRQCSKEFVFTRAEQEFYEQKGWTQPRRCKECRSGKRDEPRHLTCAQCGAELDGTVSAYCSNCHTSNLASTQLECELNNKKRESSLDETRKKLETAEIEKGELGELLSQKEQKVTELEQTVDELNKELDEVRQLQAALDQWFRPALKSLEEKLEEDLNSLEQGQNSVKQNVLQLAQKLQDIEKGCQNVTLFELIRRSFRKQTL